MSKSKQKGTSFETSLLPALRYVWPLVERRAQQGANDKGDFYLPGSDLITLEAKNVAKSNIPGWLAEAKQESVNAGTRCAAVIAKRRGVTDPFRQYVHMELGDLLVLCEWAEAGLDAAKHANR